MATPILSGGRSGALPAAAPIPSPAKTTYREILKSSAIIGGASLINLAIGVVRIKVMAVLLGPAGVGLLGLFGTIADLTRSIASMGINGSGVRQIAGAVGTNDAHRIARTVTVLRRTTVLLGIVGAALLAVLSEPISAFTFGTNRHANGVALVSLAVLFRLVADGQGALIQGMRRIGDLARMGILGALLGTIVSIGIVYVLREDGIVPSLVSVAAMSALVSWWYSRKVRIERPVMTRVEVQREAGPLLKLGVAFMASGFLMLGTAYAVRMLVLRNVGLEATGLYEAAWTVGGLYVGFVLQAMGADFYPRLVAVANDNAECNRLVNEQAHASLLLAGPGVLGTLTFAPAVLSLFYTAEFSAAVEILRWICLGMALRVISWPMGFVIVAADRRLTFFLTESAWAAVNLTLTWLCVAWLGLEGVGIAFFASYVFHCLLIYPIVHRISGFHCSRASFRTALLLIAAAGIVFTSFRLLPLALSTVFGALFTLISAALSMKFFLKLASPEHTPARVWRAFVALGLVSVRTTKT
jgi:PST family polysaccharide transporter